MAGDVLEAGEAVVAPEPGVVLEQVERERERHRLGQDRQVDAGDAAAEGEPAEDQRDEAGHRHDHEQLERQAVGEGPEPGEFGGAHDAEDLRGDAVDDLLSGGRDRRGEEPVRHDDLGPGVHQPHADGVAADGEEGHVAEREDPAVAPDHVHRDGDEAEAERLAERLDEGGGDEADARGLGERRHDEGEEASARRNHRTDGLRAMKGVRVSPRFARRSAGGFARPPSAGPPEYFRPEEAGRRRPWLRPPPRGP
jgi:hypothetical protein